MAMNPGLAEYVLERRVGVGRVSEVFHVVRGRGAREPLVQKRLRAEARLEPVAALFLEEARRVAPLLHPNLAQVVDVGVEEGVPYLVEERVEGPSLAALMRDLAARQELLPIEVSVDLALQLCRALAALHDEHGPVRGVHGAVSPWSVMVRREGVVKLTDFGVERVVARLARERPGFVEPRFGYLAPELLREETADARADQYAVGVVLWELLSGRRLFDGASAGARERTAAAPPPSTFRRRLPPGLDDVVQRALATHPEERFPRVADLEHALEALVPPLGVDDRETRVRAELERVYAGMSPDPSRNAAAPSSPEGAVPLRAFPPPNEGGLVEYTVAPEGEGGSPTYDSRALPLEGPRPEPSPPSDDGREKKRKRGMWPLLALLALLLVGGGGFALWRFSDELRGLPGLDRLSGDLPSTTAPEPPEEPSPPAAKARKVAAADRAKAERLEREAAEHLLAGNSARALKALKQAVELDPERASLHRKLAMAYADTGERYLAKRHLERYLALFPRAPDRASVEAQLKELSRD